MALSNTTAPRTTRRHVQIQLTADEIVVRARQALGLEQLVVEAALQLDRAKSHHKLVLADVAERREPLDLAVRTGEESREVDCGVVMDYGAFSVRIVRQDTGETVQERPMTEDERQGRLPMEAEEPSDQSDGGHDAQAQEGLDA